MRQGGDGLKPVGSPLRFVPPEQRAFAKRSRFATQVGNLSGRVRGEESRLEPAPRGSVTQVGNLSSRMRQRGDGLKPVGGHCDSSRRNSVILRNETNL